VNDGTTEPLGEDAAQLTSRLNDSVLRCFKAQRISFPGAQSYG
jgi:hypothetical protein